MAEIEIETKVTSIGYLHNVLSKAIGPDVRLEQRGRSPTRGLDPSVLVAIIGATGTSVAALLAGLLSIREKAKAGRILLVSRTGDQIEVPANTPTHRINELLGQLKSMEVVKVVLDRELKLEDGLPASEKRGREGK